MALMIGPVSASVQTAFVTERSGSFLQLPSWAQVKAEWRHELLGWYDSGRLVGTGLVLLRRVPGLGRYLAYLPEGPVIDWADYEALDVTRPLIAHLRKRRAFLVKMGPQLITRRWTAQTVKAAIAKGTATRLGDIHACGTDPAALAVGEQLRASGWRQDQKQGAGFGDYQPRYVFQLPIAARSLDDIFAGFNQQWRRNVRTSEKSGVTVTDGTADDLAEFHALYVATAARDGFQPRALSYFERMWSAMRADSPDRIRLYLARRGGELLASTTAVTVGGHVWYSYGASSTAGREYRGSNAVQWRMIADACTSGARTYDLRGISDSLDPADHLFGLIQFKLGTGGEAVEYLGEWDYALSPVLTRAFDLYANRR
jgi:lipid II:glycine glycyltransferase (peptidoglycan interpeptide bridge formation enzyme)